MLPFTCISRKIKHENQEETSNLRPFKDSKFRDAVRTKLNKIQLGTTTVTPTFLEPRHFFIISFIDKADFYGKRQPWKYYC